MNFADIAAAIAVILMAVESSGFLIRAAAGLLSDIGNPAATNYGRDLFIAGVAVAAVPVAILLLRRRRLGWIVFAPYEIVVLALVAAMRTNG